MKEFVQKNKEHMFTIMQELCMLPAPSHFEQKRAAYCKAWLEEAGATGAYIDEACNVIYPLGCENSREITVFSAHTDTVFEDKEPMPYHDDGTNIHAPGAGDNTASVVVLLLMARYFIENRIMPSRGILFVFNACEEGLGNLKGMKHLFSSYQGRIKQLIAFDSRLNIVHDRCVGSERFLVEVNTVGGHSYNDFGHANAIEVLSGLVNQIYTIQVPEKAGTKTTYNVGTLHGGTSVNSIAQHAEMLCEYRSDDRECLAYMRRRFEEIFRQAERRGVQITIKEVGARPCAEVEPEKMEALKRLVVPVIEKAIGEAVTLTSASTDCNIPLSLGVPALCVGVSQYEGMHTREEYVVKESMERGLYMALTLGKAITELENGAG